MKNWTRRILVLNILKVRINKMDLEFREVHESDFSSCAKGLMAAFEGAPWNENWTYDQAYQRIGDIMSARVSKGYVACDGEKVIAMALGRMVYYLDWSQLYIDEFSVHPDYQGKKIGSELLDYVRKALKKDDVQYITLDTQTGFPAVNFYEKNGFEKLETVMMMSTKI